MESKYDLSSYKGRFFHFLNQQNPLNIFASEKHFDKAFEILAEKKHNPDDEFWRAKYLVDSAYHSATGEKIILPGRMCFQGYRLRFFLKIYTSNIFNFFNHKKAPGNSALAILMMALYKTPLQAISGQFANQSFNAIVNYSNSPKPVLNFQVLGDFKKN